MLSFIYLFVTLCYLFLLAWYSSAKNILQQLVVKEKVYESQQKFSTISSTIN